MIRNKIAASSFIIMFLFGPAMSSELLPPEMEEIAIDTTDIKEREVKQKGKGINDSLVIAYYISNSVVYSDKNLQAGGYIGLS